MRILAVLKANILYQVIYVGPPRGLAKPPRRSSTARFGEVEHAKRRVLPRAI